MHVLMIDCFNLTPSCLLLFWLILKIPQAFKVFRTSMSTSKTSQKPRLILGSHSLSVAIASTSASASLATIMNIFWVSLLYVESAFFNVVFSFFIHIEFGFVICRQKIVVVMSHLRISRFLKNHPSSSFWIFVFVPMKEDWIHFSELGKEFL